MHSTKILSCFVDGLEARQVEVEVDILPGFPGLSIVGLGDTAVQEAKERMRSAIKNSGANYPQQKKIINLAPAHMKKNGACFDLPMALGLLIASGQIESPPPAIFVGELALNGEVRAITGALSVAIFAKKYNLEIFLPAENIVEVQILNYDRIYPVENLRELIEHLKENTRIQTLQNANWLKRKPQIYTPEAAVDMNIIQGQISPKCALEIAAAGGHHLIMYGPPGTGKTLLAQALQGILPPLTQDEMIEVMQIYSTAGLLKNSQRDFTLRPFRHVHQSCSLPGLVGGGSVVSPGEISLAHNGILFFDEIAEAPKNLLESLRQPLEDRKITISRVHHHVTFPANFTLVAAMNPCPCGYYGSSEKACSCSNNTIVQYHKKLSGPLLDRFDLFLQMEREPIKIEGKTSGKSSREIQQKIIAARERQHSRFKGMKFTVNSLITPSVIHQFCKMDSETEKLMIEHANKMKISTRGFHKIIKVARTIADLNGNDRIQNLDALEALNFRMKPTSPLV